MCCSSALHVLRDMTPFANYTIRFDKVPPLDVVERRRNLHYVYWRNSWLNLAKNEMHCFSLSYTDMKSTFPVTVFLSVKKTYRDA